MKETKKAIAQMMLDARCESHLSPFRIQPLGAAFRHRQAESSLSRCRGEMPSDVLGLGEKFDPPYRVEGHDP